MKRLALALLLVCATSPAPAEWHHPLYLSRGGYWRGRVPVRIRNRTGRDVAGEPVAVRIGGGKGEADLAGARAEALRLTAADGTELLYALADADGTPVRRGPVPAGGTLTLPAEVPADGTATCYVYFGNPRAWAVAEYLEAAVGLRNGGVERGQGATPTAWRHDEGDARHSAAWVTGHPHGGRRCLKTVVAEGAEPSWISTRQRGIRITGGARYRATAWVRAENVQGRAGWYIHLEPRNGRFIASPMLLAGGGTYGWTQVSAEFTAPEQAVRASLGTVLRGTGTAWFDDVRLECLDPPRLSAAALPPETMDLRRSGGAEAWLDPPGEAPAPPHRMAYRAFNFAGRDAQKRDAARRPGLASADLAALAGRLRAPLDRGSLVVARGKEVLEHVAVGDRLLFEADVPARSVCDYHVYAATDTRAPRAAAGNAAGQGGDAADLGRAAYARLLSSPRNMARNPSFEAGGDFPDEWTGGTEKPRAGGATATRVEGGPFGEHCIRIHVPQGAAAGWIGWHQSHAVEAGRTYLYAAWVKGEGIAGGGVRLHAHGRTAEGALCDRGGYNAVGSPLEGTRGWTLLAGTLTMPPDCAELQLHLTMNATGTLWHDGVVLARVTPVEPLGLQVRRDPTPARITAWPVNPVVKVFRWDAPPEKPAPARLTAARNESEPLQLAVRGPRDVRGVRVEVDPPIGPGGARLADVETGIVGYVPIDHPTSYYRSEAPAWHRKYPRRPGACDGWAGWWPDPLLPRDTFDLAADRTQPVWVTVHVPTDARPGDYRGRVRLLAGKSDGGSPHPPRAGGGGQPSAAGAEKRRAGSDAVVLAEVPFTIHVWDFALPEDEHLKAVYDVRLHGQWWRNDIGEDRRAYLKRFWTFMADRRVCPDRIRPGPVLRYSDGRVEADFSAYDEAAAYYFDVLGLPHAYTPRCFYCFGWGHPPRKAWGEAPYPGEYPYEGVDRSRLRPEYKRAYQACLRAYWNHMKEKGWADRVVLYISDEPHDRRHEYVIKQMKALCAMIHEVDPAIPIYSSTWHHQDRWDGSLDVWGVGHQGRTPPETMRAIRGRGDRLWFTTDGQMCTDTPYCAVERLLPHYCFAHGAEAYEFWGVDWLTYDPYAFGWHAYIHQSDRPGHSYWVRYPNGDGYLAYPGSPAGHDGPVSSIRLEQAREGVEDYEYLYLLRERIRKAKAAGRDVADAEAVLADAAGLVPIPNAGGRYATKILPDPDAVLRLKERLAEAIERLGG